MRDCVKMVQYHDPRLPTLSILDTLGPEKVILIVKCKAFFFKWLLFSVGIFTSVQGGFHWDANNSTGLCTIHI